MVNFRLRLILPWAFALVFALTRWPGLLPPNFSAAYALVFCAGALLPGRLGWALPFGAMLVTDLVLNLYYRISGGWDVFTGTGLLFLAMNYLGYAALFGLGRAFGLKARFLTLLGGGLLGAVLFYLVTNTAAWLFNPFRNPEYTRDLFGWIVALTKGTGGYPQTWEFFRNTLLSGGLFTALFAGSWKLTSAESPSEKGEESEPAEEPQGEARSEKRGTRSGWILG
ncbi:MAG TPA: hypothetical protein DCE44_03045 [Verrucomicrobiales bacterium]|nr:hypothetical protein [Verrucomicrobiales bacterium]